MEKILIHSVLLEKPDIEEEILKNENYNLVFVENDNQTKFYEEAKTADAIVIADRLMPQNVIESLEKCKIIVRQGIGFDSIDLEKAKEKHIIVANVPDYCVDEVSDFTMTLALTLLRNIVLYNNHTREGIWDINSIYNISNQAKMRRFSKQNFAIFGFGKIGKLTAKKAQAFGFNILAYDPYVDEETAKKLGVNLVDFDTALKEADLITINMPLTDETRHLFNLENFEKMKKSAYLVNTGRGPLVNEDDLYTALKNGLIAGAAIDVTETEPLDKSNKLFTLENLIVTPHAAFFSEDSFVDLRKRALQEAIRVLKGDKAENQVNK